MIKLLVCESRIATLSPIADNFFGKLSVKSVNSVSDYTKTVSSFSPDVILLEKGFSALQLTDAIQIIKKSSRSPIMYACTPEDTGSVAALSHINDFICFPINEAELYSRICRLNTFYDPVDSESSVFRNGELKINYTNCCVSIGNTPVHLTLLEYRLLCLLSKNCGTVVKYNVILNELWTNPIGNEILSLRVFVTALRKKLQAISRDENYLHTHMGEGYCMPQIETNG